MKEQEYLALEFQYNELQKEKDNMEKDLRKQNQLCLELNFSEAKLQLEKTKARDDINKLMMELQKYKEEIEDLNEFRVQKVQWWHYIFSVESVL